ncbi:MAG: hypothetical protein IPJ65_27595 [Archangiaceae bacterium]|nr:hypothetical protein [Archangiaceae bacterium]
MNRRMAIFAATALFCACDPKIDKVEPEAVVVADFDPSAETPVVPTPNDLAADPATGILNITPPPTASDVDKAFYDYLNGLDGFPASASASTTFSGALDPTRATSTAAVHVYDITDNFAKVTVAPVYTETTVDAVTKGRITIPPPATGWVPGHRYAVGLVAGEAGLKGSSDNGGRPVVGSATWSFLRLEKTLVTCSDLSSPDCKSKTLVIPSNETDPERRIADQAKSAVQLEQLRLKYKPVIDRLITDGAKREDIALAWTFAIADYTQLVFDPSATPPKVPAPNDLAIDPTTGLVKVPIDPAYSDAYKEFITDYLNTLDGFPVSATASVAVQGGDLDANTVNARSVLVLDLKGAALPPPTITWNGTAKTIDVAPANGSWGKGRQIAIAVIGRRATDVGDSEAGPAVERVGGGAVVASTVWALTRSAGPLVDCPNDDLTSPDCKLLLTAAPLPLASALKLEPVRRAYQPALAALEAKGIDRADVAILWTFRTVSLGEATFDPAASIVPFPNNVLRSTGANPHLTLPVPDGGSALQVGLVTGLNTLDGFSLTAPIISESSDTRGALDIGAIDPASLDAGTGFIKVAGAGAQPRVRPCLDCASSLQADGGAPTGPQQLQFVPQLPLEEQSTYAAYLSSRLTDTAGKRVIAAPAFALTRLSNSLCVDNKSTVPVVSDLQACGAGGAPGLEQLRQGLKPLVDNLVTAGLPRKDLALVWAFTTESTVSQLQGLHDAVAAVGLPTTVTSALVASSTGVPQALAAVVPAPLPTSHLEGVYIGTLTLPFAATGPGGVILPPASWSTQKAAYMLTVPKVTASVPLPPGGWPVVIFGHGLTSNRTTLVAIADTLAGAGFATFGIDVIWHGERTTCTGSASVLAASIPGATDDYACTAPGGTMPDPVNARCSATGRCVKRTGTGTACASDVQCMTTGQGYCTAGFCEGADLARNAQKQPLVNAWNFLNLGNLFAARDNFRHYAIDLAQVVRVVKANAFEAAGGPKVDGMRINYIGLSLGGFNGTLFSAVDPDVNYVMLNVPGSDQADVLLQSPGFATVRTGFLAQLAPLGLVPGTPQFDQLITLIKTIFDRADPQVFGFTAVNRAMPGTRRVFIQSIQDDFVVPNFATDKLIAAATSGAKQPVLERINPPFSTLAPADRHSFLLNFRDPATTAAAQTKAATFMLTGTP